MKYSLRYSKTGMIHDNHMKLEEVNYQVGISEDVIRRLQVVVELVDCQDSTTALNTERAYKRSAVCTLLAKTRHLR